MLFKILKLLLVKPSSLDRRLHTTKNNSGGLYFAIRKTLLCSRLLGLLPLSGLWSSTSDQLRFTLRSSYTIVYTISMFGQLLMCVMSFCWLLENGISLSNITNFFFYSSSLTSSIILMIIGKRFPRMLMSAESIETVLPPLSSQNTKVCDATMTLVLTAALVEHILSVSFGFSVAFSCGSRDVVETFFRSSMPWIFDYTTYSLWKGILSEIFNIQSTFMWSFNDLLLMVLSIYLTEHILIHNELLRKAVNQECFSAKEFRIQHLNLVRLVRLINGQVGIYILNSFGTNLYWICTQLYNSLNNTKTGHFLPCYDDKPGDYQGHHALEHAVYFTYSFTFIVLRTLLVLLLAARIHSNSKMTLILLYELPSEKYDLEVERFVAQINNIKVALSGLDFFYVTRTMILTLTGTIVTYELVMLQFNKA